MNLKKGKTESMIFGTQKRLSSNVNKLNLVYENQPIASTTQYKYLGTQLDQTLSMNSNFDNLYKKASSKLRMLSTLKNKLTREAIRKIHTAIILPALLHNCVVNLKLTQTQIKKFDSLDKRVSKLIGEKLPSNYK